MTDNSEREANYQRALRRLVRNIDKISDPASDAYIIIDCHDGFFLRIRQADWLILLTEVDVTFGSKVKDRMVNATVSHYLGKTYSACGFPLKDGELRDFIGNSFRDLLAYSKQRTEFLFPLGLMKFARNEFYSIPLANAVLYPADTDSRLVKIAGRANNKIADASWHQHGFLRIVVSGDSDARRSNALTEAENALKVLRFVGEWRSEIRNNRIQWNNSAINVTLKRDSSIPFYGYPAGNADGTVRTHVHQANPTTSSEVFWTNAHDFYGLDDINYHFQNRGNTISEQVIRALTLYDNGIQAFTDWEAIYLYVHCINVAVLTGQSSSSKLPQDVRTLIQFGNGYLSTNRANSGDHETSKRSWTELVLEKTNPFGSFYEMRSKIIHGSEMNFGRITSEKLKEARELAHNCVRIIAFLARQHDWSDNDTVKNWLKAKRRKWEAEQKNK